MKKRLRFTTPIHFLLLGILTCMIGCGNSNEPKESLSSQEITVVKAEDSIDLSLNPIDTAKGHRQMDTCKWFIKIQGITSLPSYADSIESTALAALRLIASGLQSPTPDHYICALKIIYALNADSTKMELLYKPVLLKRKVIDTPKVNVEYEPTVAPSFYKYDHTIDSFVTTNDISGIARYRNAMKFKRLGSSVFTDFDPNDSTGDVRSIVFSFQEISAELKQNKSTVLFLLNADESVKISGQMFLKHTLLLAPDVLRFTKDTIFYRRFGNLSHLCPPSCNNHFFNLK
jgi:hypothetical protein